MKSTLLIALFFPLLTMARTEICPDLAPTQIAPQFESNVKFNKKKGIYTYKYTLTNLPEAAVPVWKFSIEADSSPIGLTAAKGWENGGFDRENHEITWNYNAVGAPLRPGKTVSGFTIESKNPPQLVRVFVDGDVTDVPTVKFDNDEDEINADVIPCVGYFKGERNRDQVTSVVTGPALNRTEVVMRVKKSKEALWVGNPTDVPELSLSPLDEGALDLVIFDGKGVDVSQIKLTSLELGTGRAKINPSKVVIRSGFAEPRDTAAFAHVKKNPGNYLKVEFNIQDLHLRCNADKALFLSGTFDDGKELFGAVVIKSVDCNDKNFAPEAARQRSNRK